MELHIFRVGIAITCSAFEALALVHILKLRPLLTWQWTLPCANCDDVPFVFLLAPFFSLIMGSNIIWKKKKKLQCVIEFELIFCELISLCVELLSEDTGL